MTGNWWALSQLTSMNSEKKKHMKLLNTLRRGRKRAETGRTLNFEEGLSDLPVIFFSGFFQRADPSQGHAEQLKLRKKPAVLLD